MPADRWTDGWTIFDRRVRHPCHSCRAHRARGRILAQHASEQNLATSTKTFLLYLMCVAKREGYSPLTSLVILASSPLLSQANDLSESTRVRSAAIAEMYQKSTLSIHPVCGRRLSSCQELKNWLENAKSAKVLYIPAMTPDLTLVLLT